MTKYVIITVYVPVEHTEAVRVAMCGAGAGTVSDGYYDYVTYISPAICKYRVLNRRREPGQPMGEEYESEQNRIEAICPCDRIDQVLKAICQVHPYETPAIAIYPTLTGEYKYWQGGASEGMSGE